MKIRHLSLLLVLLLAGCSRQHVCGVSLSLGKFERGLWYDHDKQQYDENGFGVKFDIVSGQRQGRRCPTTAVHRAVPVCGDWSIRVLLRTQDV